MSQSDLEERFRKLLKGQWGLYVNGRLSVDGNFTSDQLRKIASLADEMRRENVDFIEIGQDLDWDDEDE